MKELEPMDIPAPPIGTKLKCLLCAEYKPWGIFQSTTGVAICIDCRDGARACTNLKDENERLRALNAELVEALKMVLRENHGLWDDKVEIINHVLAKAQTGDGE